MPRTPSNPQLVLASVRRVREASPRHRVEPELAHATRFRDFLQAILDSADAGSLRPLEAHLEQTIPLLARRGLVPSELRLELAEAERALEQLAATDGWPRDRSERSRRALRLAERMLVAGVQARRRESRSEDHLRLTTLLDALPEAIVLADADGRVQLANEKAREIYALPDAAGRPLQEVLTGKPLLARLADPDGYLEATGELLSDGFAQREDLFRDDEDRSYVRRWIPVGDGGSAGRVVITTGVEDLRERKPEAPATAAPPASAIPLRAGRPRLTLVAGSQR
jgi:PAS domain-containing protein